MKDFISKVLKIFTLPLRLLILLSVLSFGSLIYIFVNGLEQSVFAYVDYLLSAYTLTALCLFCVKTLPDTIKNVKEKANSNKLVYEYTHNESLKTKSTIYISFVINLAYIIINAFSAFYYETAWFMIFSVYYAIIAVMRFIISRFVHFHGQNDSMYSQLKIARACSVIMLTLNLTLTASVLMMLYQGRGFEQRGILIYVIALYTFYSTINAAVDVIKYRKLNKPVISISTMIKLAEALVSMLLLETSMLAQFGVDTTLEFKRLMISLTGGGIAVVITFMSIYMFVKCNYQLKHIKK
ncbi:MAG: hypothetical protein IJ275_02540 [Ruminococcus sp.]|nr:hypothetical protein [Ruminococcus sp.]